MWVGGTHNAKSEALGGATVFFSDRLGAGGLDIGSRPAWEFPDPSPRFPWFCGSGLELGFGRSQV